MVRPSAVLRRQVTVNFFAFDLLYRTTNYPAAWSASSEVSSSA
ncbi:DNA ligase (plasmid) [Rhodococcus sp. WAY2]|nr:DNA ligase [Rhodococcus sp. WAY2]